MRRGARSPRSLRAHAGETPLSGEPPMKIDERSILALFGVVLVASCSSSTPSSTTDAGGDSAVSGSGSGGSSGGSGSSSSGSGGSSGGSGSSSGGGSGGGDAAGPILSGTGTPGMGPIKCGTGATCTSPSVCCSGAAGGPMCTSLATCDQNNDSFTCTSPANCTAPAVCCFRQGVTAQGNDQTTCETSCSGGRGMPQQVCLTDTDCPTGLVCGTSGGAPAGVLMSCVPGGAPDSGTPPIDSGTPPVDAGGGGDAADARAPDTGVADTGSDAGAG